MAVKIIADIGSCHGNRWKYFERAIDVAQAYGISLKCQLFGHEQVVGGNIKLSPDLFSEAMDAAEDAGVEMFASVWGEVDYYAARAESRSAIKFAYSQRNNPLISKALEDFNTVYISCQHLDLPEKDHTKVRRLLCLPQYPVYQKLYLAECFPVFHGFSDHTLGIMQTCEAIARGAQCIEKHVKFEGYTDCPDAKFAIDEVQLERLVAYAR